jgi:hypothetical protein
MSETSYTRRFACAAKKKAKVLCLIIFYWSLSTCYATIVIMENNYSYESQPALFGRRFSPNMKYMARLQQIDEDPYLCGGSTDVPTTFDEQQTTYEYMVGTTTYQQQPLPPPHVQVPSDGSSVVLLAKRGKCSFETKARTAMTALPKGVVKFLIVYNNESSEDLSPMSAANPQGINIGLLFISLQSGQNIIHNMTENNSSNSNNNGTQKSSGGLLLSMDSNSPWGPYNYFFDDQDGWIALLMFSGVIVISIFCGCLLVGCQAGYIRREGNVIIFGSLPTTNITTLLRDTDSQISSSLLTEDQVLALPLIHYWKADQPWIDPKEQHHPSKEDSSSNETLIPSYLEEIVMCSICLEEYEVGEQLRLLPCKHCFHTDCILPWLTQRSPMCPLCKCDISRTLRSPRSSSSSMDLEEHSSSSLNSITPTTEEEESGGEFDSSVRSLLLSSFLGRRLTLLWDTAPNSRYNYEDHNEHNNNDSDNNNALTTPLLEERCD